MSDTVLNYIWIHPDELRPRQIPEDYFGDAIETSRKHTGVDKFLWVDSLQRLNICSERTHSAGLRVRDLRKIAAYAHNPLFDKQHDARNRESIIWHQVDLARILVLQHCLKNLQYKTAFYSDLDMRFNLGDRRLKSVMDRYGMAFGQCALPGGDVFLENQFIGMEARSADFMKNVLLPEIYETMTAGEQPYGLGPLYRALQRQFPEFESPFDLEPLTVEAEEVTGMSRPKAGWQGTLLQCEKR